MGPEILEPLAAGYAALPPYEDGQHIDDQRRPLHAMLASVREQVTPYPTVDVEDVSVPGAAGDLTLRIYRPHTPSTSRPGIYLIHGGAMVLGNLDFDHLPALMLCEITGAVIVSVDYRLAPEHPYPAALDDCIAGLRWMGPNTTALDIDADRLAMFGLSAGGGLALAAALRVRDEGGPVARSRPLPTPPDLHRRRRPGPVPARGGRFRGQVDAGGRLHRTARLPVGGPRVGDLRSFLRPEQTDLGCTLQRTRSGTLVRVATRRPQVRLRRLE